MEALEEKLIRDRWHKRFIGARQQHTYWLYKVIDDILMDYPDIKHFLEIGTGQGALSAYFYLHALSRDGKLWTYDYQDRRTDTIKNLFVDDGCFFKKENVFDCIEDIKWFLSWEKTFLFCDGDDKAKEFNTFAPLLCPGSVIAVHDWDDEVKLDDLDTTGLQPLRQDEWNAPPDYIATSFWEKI